MSFRVAFRSTRLPRASGLRAKRGYSSSSEQFQDFFRARPVPIEAYPLIGITFIMYSFAGYHLTKHIVEDRDHLRWKPTGHHATAHTKALESRGTHLFRPNTNFE